MMELAGAEFETSRLRVEEWHTRASRTNLVEFVMRLLTPEVTKALPPSWHGSYDRERAEAWIAERDEESAVLLVSEIATNKPVGLVLLGENRTKGDGASRDVRLGYLLAEDAWGRGFASEIVGGFVAWCETRDSIRSILAGVSVDNEASKRVLLKNGFVLTGAPRHGEQMYRCATDPGLP